MDVRTYTYKQMPINPRVEEVRVVQHIRERGALDLWMGEPVDPRRPDRNTRHYRSHLNMGCGNLRGHPTPHLPLDHYTRREVMAVQVWNEMEV